jgi:hypothetical protein
MILRRLDCWLNSQRGWRGTPGLDIAFLQVVAWSALAAMPLTGPIAYGQRTRAVRTGRPAFSWRASAGMLLFLAACELTRSATAGLARALRMTVSTRDLSYSGVARGRM